MYDVIIRTIEMVLFHSINCNDVCEQYIQESTELH